MDEKELFAAANYIAETTSRHLDQPTTPPLHWRIEGDQIRVLLADGRTVRGQIVPVPTGKTIKHVVLTKTPAEIDEAIKASEHPTLSEKVLVTLDSGKTLTMRKDEVRSYQEKHKEAIFIKIEPKPISITRKKS